MPARPTTLAGTTGEHYVAYLLSCLGYIAALTRGGSSSIDILASNKNGSRTLGIQVKTSNWAYRDSKREPETSPWEFDVGPKAVGKGGDSFLHAFVSLFGEKQPKPLVLIVSPSDVATWLGKGSARNMFGVFAKDAERRSSANWNLITDRLGSAD